MLYEIKNLTKVYGGRSVLDLSCSLEKGSVTGLLGPNGSGKTTLLEILAFLSSPTSGDIYFKGSKVDFGKTDLISLRKGAVLLQQKPILFTTTIYNNLEFPLKVRKIDKIKRRKIIDQLLSLVGMEKFSNARAHTLSGGETQRVALAQALACAPEVILMDEPTSSVDVENQIIIEDIIKEINRSRGISVVFTTHDRILASRLTDKILYLHEGKITDAANENLFTGVIEKDALGNIFCVIRNGLKIPVTTEKAGKVRISINPDGIRLKSSMKDDGNAKSFKGRIIQLTDEREYIRALIDIGLPLNVFIKKNKTQNQSPCIGDYIQLILDPEKIEVF